MKRLYLVFGHGALGSHTFGSLGLAVMGPWGHETLGSCGLTGSLGVVMLNKAPRKKAPGSKVLLQKVSPFKTKGLTLPPPQAPTSFASNFNQVLLMLTL